MTRLRHQTITIDVTTRGPDSPWGALKRHLQNFDTQFVDAASDGRVAARTLAIGKQRRAQRAALTASTTARVLDEGRLAEEWVRTDYRSFLRQLGAEGR